MAHWAQGDYSPFIQHLGIPALNIGFGGEDDGGEYHSIYDSYDLYKGSKTPHLNTGTLAKTAGRITYGWPTPTSCRLTLWALQNGKWLCQRGYLLLDNMRESTEVENQMIHENRYVQASDPKKTFVQPSTRACPYLDFSNVLNAQAGLEKAPGEYAELIKLNPNPNTNLERLNKLLYTAEQSSRSTAGFPHTLVFQHTIYAPGYYTGYGVKTLPGVREAIEQRNWKEAQEQIEILAKTWCGTPSKSMRPQPF